MSFSNEIIEVLDYLCKKFGLVVDWTNDSVMPYLQQLAEKYVRWEISTSYAWIGIVIALLMISALLMIVDIKTDFADNFFVLVFVVVLVMAIIVISCQIFDIIKCNVFPEKAIFDYLMDLKQQYSR